MQILWDCEVVDLFSTRSKGCVKDGQEKGFSPPKLDPSRRHQYTNSVHTIKSGLRCLPITHKNGYGRFLFDVLNTGGAAAISVDSELLRDWTKSHFYFRFQGLSWTNPMSNHSEKSVNRLYINVERWFICFHAFRNTPCYPENREFRSTQGGITWPQSIDGRCRKFSIERPWAHERL